MRVEDLVEKLDNTEILHISEKSYDKDVLKYMLENKINKMDIKIYKKISDDLESLGYSFEVGV